MSTDTYIKARHALRLAAFGRTHTCVNRQYDEVIDGKKFRVKSSSTIYLYADEKKIVECITRMYHPYKDDGTVDEDWHSGHLNNLQIVVERSKNNILYEEYLKMYFNCVEYGPGDVDVRFRH